MNIYEKNLEFFRDNLQSIYDCLMFEKSKYSSNVSITNNPLNLIVENEEKRCFVHSTYDTERENTKMFSFADKNAEKLVIFGFGIGKAIDYIYKNFKNLRNITIIEPDLNVFKTMLSYIDIVELIRKVGNITFIINKTKEEACDILWDCIKDNLTEKVEFVYNISYRSLYLEYFEYINKKISSNIKNYMINIATEDLFIFQWTENAIKNFKEYAYTLTRLIGKFNEIPVILVSAGPSLNYTIQYLKEVKDKAIILALGSAIKILDSNNIIPHFRIAFDGSEAERNVFKGIDTEASALIFSDLLNYNILKDYKGKKIRMVLDTDYISQYFQSEIYNANYVFESGFSVVNVALDVVLKLGFKKIIFIGQDLCYTEGSVHAKGTWRKDDNEVKFDGSRFVNTTNVLGEKVYTDKPFLGMKDYLEQKIKLNNGITYINATERGLNIEGTINKTFLKVMEEDFNKQFDIENILNEVFNGEAENNTNINKLRNLSLSLIDELEELIKINDYRLKKLKKLNKYFERGLGITKLQTELKYIKSIDNELENNDYYKKSIKPTMFNKFKTIYMNYAYNGKEEKIIIEKNIKALLGVTVELKQYLDFLKDLLKQ